MTAPLTSPPGTKATPFAPRPHPLDRPAAPPNLRLVDPRAQRGRRAVRAVTALLAVAACAGLFAIVALRVLLAQGQGEVDRLEAAATTQQASQQRLRLTVAELESPARIVAAARGRLGMVPPAAVIPLTPPPASAR